MSANIPSDDELKRLRDEVSMYPTDLEQRFRLGAALLARHDHTGGIPELLEAMRGPRVRLAAMNLLIDAFEARHMYDLAKHFRERVSRESGEEGDSGSTPVPIPTRPVTPQGSLSHAERPPRRNING